MHLIRSFLAVLLLGMLGHAQIPEYDFYPEFRGWSQQLRRSVPALTSDQVLERYSTRLRGEGTSEAEVQRRDKLLRTSRNRMEDDFWNRFFTQGTSNYNQAPNGFLVEVVEGRKAGTALDYAMGEGRNALFLAKLGWQVSGFDPATEAVALAQRRAKDLGLRLDAKTVRDSEYDFGQDRFDSVLFSWAMPEAEYAEKVVRALKPGGIVVMECGADWVGRNGMLKLFDALQVIRYEIVSAKSDFYNRREMDVLRLVARKPGS